MTTTQTTFNRIETIYNLLLADCGRSAREIVSDWNEFAAETAQPTMTLRQCQRALQALKNADCVLKTNSGWMKIGNQSAYLPVAVGLLPEFSHNQPIDRDRIHWKRFELYFEIALQNCKSANPILAFAI